MSMLGIDIGNWTCHMIYKKDITTSDIEFPWARTNVKTQISQIKCLLGRKFSDPELQLELDYVPFRVIEGPDGYPLVHGRCKGEDRAFTPVEILAMLLSTPEFRAHSSPTPCIGIPIHFTNQQKKDVFQAAKIAGLPASFCLLDEITAMVVSLEREMFWGAQSIVAFVDIGHASTQVCFAEFKRACSSRSDLKSKRSVNILYKGSARSLGGREIDKVLFNHFASKIRNEYNIDVSQNNSTCVRLREACESLKSKLSSNNEASFFIEKFSGLIDVKGSITRKDFESLSSTIFIKIEVALKKALSESGLNVENIKYVEAVGKGCSIPAIIDILTKIFGKKGRETTYSEHIARGCAIQGKHINITGTDKMIKDLNGTGPETSKLASRKLNSGKDKAEDSEKFLWTRAMEKEGHLLKFVNDFLEENMYRIGRSEKTTDESYGLCKAKMLKDSSSQGEKELNEERENKTTYYTGENKNKQHNPYNTNEQMPAHQVQLSEAQKLIEQLRSERDNAKKEVEELRRLTELQCVGYFAQYSYSELQHATNNFHDSFKLGEGGYGIVYRGNLHNTTIAIKVLKEGSSQGAKEFHQEIEILSKVRHPNLVTLIGACAENHAVIYEYLPNGSLEDRLRCKNNTPPLLWQARIRIAFEICSALSFLHCSKPHGIVHGDLKPDNILLDSNNVSKISDFGVCRELKWTAGATIAYHLTDYPKGTLPYMDPEYFSMGKITPQSDVYSFGIMLLRLVTCQDPRGIRYLVEDAQTKGTLKTLIKTSGGGWPSKIAKKMISLGLRCSEPGRRNRPDLSTEVWKEMKSIAEVASAPPSSWAASLIRRG